MYRRWAGVRCRHFPAGEVNLAHVGVITRSAE